MTHRLLVLVLIVALPCLALAVMPPHVHGTSPPDKGILKGDTVTFFGNSLGYADARAIKVSNLTTAKPAPFTHKMNCKWVNNCKPPKRNMPGCGQQHCQLKIKLTRVVPGQRYQLSFLRTTITVTAAKSGKSGRKKGSRRKR